MIQFYLIQFLESFGKIRNFGQKSKFGSKIEMFVKNRRFGQKMKVLVKFKILVKKQNIGQKSKIFENFEIFSKFRQTQPDWLILGPVMVLKRCNLKKTGNLQNCLHNSI